MYYLDLQQLTGYDGTLVIVSEPVPDGRGGSTVRGITYVPSTGRTGVKLNGEPVRVEVRSK